MRQVHLSVVLASAVLATGCAREVGSDTPTEAAGASRATVAVAASETTTRGSFKTHLYSDRDADLYSRLMVDENVGVGTPVTAIQVEVGNRVRTGQVLANLDAADARLFGCPWQGSRLNVQRAAARSRMDMHCEVDAFASDMR